MSVLPGPTAGIKLINGIQFDLLYNNIVIYNQFDGLIIQCYY